MPGKYMSLQSTAAHGAAPVGCTEQGSRRSRLQRRGLAARRRARVCVAEAAALLKVQHVKRHDAAVCNNRLRVGGVLHRGW